MDEWPDYYEAIPSSLDPDVVLIEVEQLIQGTRTISKRIAVN
jgi:hypothetical protein